LLELGIALYRKLPVAMAGRLWQKNPTFDQKQQLQLQIAQRASQLALSGRLDRIAAFRVSAGQKEQLHEAAVQQRQTVSNLIRQKIFRGEEKS